MATVLINTQTEIAFCNNLLGSKPAEFPTLKAIAGDWEVDNSVEAGIVFEAGGKQDPMLTAADARKLSKWLARAADLLDNVKPQKKKHTYKQYEEEDDENEQYGFKFKT